MMTARRRLPHRRSAETFWFEVVGLKYTATNDELGHWVGLGDLAVKIVRRLSNRKCTSALPSSRKRLGA